MKSETLCSWKKVEITILVHCIKQTALGIWFPLNTVCFGQFLTQSSWSVCVTWTVRWVLGGRGRVARGRGRVAGGRGWVTRGRGRVNWGSFCVTWTVRWAPWRSWRVAWTGWMIEHWSQTVHWMNWAGQLWRWRTVAQAGLWPVLV